MAADQLKQRLQHSEVKLREIATGFSIDPNSSLHEDCKTEIKKFPSQADKLVEISNLIDTREYVRGLLHQLLLDVDRSTNAVNFLGREIHFNHARLQFFLSYLSLTWAVCDSVTLIISPLVCNQSISLNQSKPLQLSRLVEEENDSAYYNHLFLNRNYSWPICISYIIRNHFVHDGTILSNGKNFFAGSNVIDGYDISPDGWNFLNKQIKKFKHVKQDYHRIGSSYDWLTPQNNLLQLLESCNDEIDEALSCLVTWSVGMLTLQIECLLKRDGLGNDLTDETIDDSL